MVSGTTSGSRIRAGSTSPFRASNSQSFCLSHWTDGPFRFPAQEAQLESPFPLPIRTGTTPANTPPSISPIQDVTLGKEAPSALIVFSISDPETPEALSVTSSSSNKALVPESNIEVSPGGANRTLVITPVASQVGQSIITLTVKDAGGKTASTSFVLSVIAPSQGGAASRGDFNGDGQPDLVFQDRIGFLAAWILDGANFQSATLFEPSNVGDLSYRIAGSADFDRDGREDLLFQNREGALAVWLLEGTRLLKTIALEPSRPDALGWSVAASADLNADTKPDLILQHSDGAIEVWLMDGTRRSQRVQTNPANPGDRNWRVVASGDFNGDRLPDMVFQHTDGNLAVWILNGTAMTTGVLLNPPRFGDVNTKVVSAADRNQGGQADLLFQNVIDGSLTLWWMEGINRSSVQPLNPPKPGGTWSAVAPR
ncbi:MAG: hypothetical protein FJ398_24570 [Verrucomicrobia bacterium]|nr:hypothetical protein [Verrucomicrobiota bacterium]